MQKQGQVILYGPPGTGKTYTAKRAALEMLRSEGINLDHQQDKDTNTNTNKENPVNPDALNELPLGLVGATGGKKPDDHCGHPETRESLVEKTKISPLNEKDYETLKATIDTLAFLTQELQAKGASVQKLRTMLFGPSTEKLKNIFGDEKDDQKKKRKGHGRNGAADYTGAERIPIEHATLKPGDNCPECLKGKVYRQKDPASIIRIIGIAPLQAKIYECERLYAATCAVRCLQRNHPRVWGRRSTTRAHRG